VNLDEDQCRVRMAAARHGVLATVHPVRGVDAVPVVFAFVGSQLVVPLDTVKAKRSGDLRRAQNLASDDRCVLLVEQYHEDWSKLWWVRLHAHATVTVPSPAAQGALAARYPVYTSPGSIERTIILTPSAWYGWQASEPLTPPPGDRGGAGPALGE
jgi:PPOX class probable F420-dependent enzyme